MGLGLSPAASSNKIIEQKQSNDTVNQSALEIDNIKTFSLNEKEFDLLKNYISNILPLDKTSNKFVDEIINSIKNMLKDQPLLLKKTLVISQGWSYDINFFKNTRFQIKRDIFSFWHYTSASKTGVESKTFIMRSNGLLSSRSAELYIGKQTGIMYRPIGLYFFQKNMFPLRSYTLFIGFASYVYINAEKEVNINPPSTLP
jgi:hypothetical protein